MSDPNPNQLSIESQAESIDRAQTNVEFAPASADRKSDEQRSRIYLLFEREQFDKYEHWLRLGLIYPAHPNDADEHGKFEGLSEELGSLPFSTQIIDFDILVGGFSLFDFQRNDCITHRWNWNPCVVRFPVEKYSMGIHRRYGLY